MNKTILIGGLATLALAASAYAATDTKMNMADPNGDKAMSKAESTDMAAKIFAKIDVNGDGKIDATDREANEKNHFAAMDSNHDGQISESEFMAAHATKRSNAMAMKDQTIADGGKHHMGGAGHKMKMMMMLKMADANGDKTVTRDEFMAASAAHFAKVDTNNDGSISVQERKAARQGQFQMMREKMHNFVTKHGAGSMQ